MRERFVQGVAQHVQNRGGREVADLVERTPGELQRVPGQARRRPRCRCGTTRHNTRGPGAKPPAGCTASGAIERVLRGHAAPINSAACVDVGSDELHACAGVSSAPGKSSHRRYGGPAVYRPSAMYRWHLVS